MCIHIDMCVDMCKHGTLMLRSTNLESRCFCSTAIITHDNRDTLNPRHGQPAQRHDGSAHDCTCQRLLKTSTCGGGFGVHHAMCRNAQTCPQCGEAATEEAGAATSREHLCRAEPQAVGCQHVT